MSGESTASPDAFRQPRWTAVVATGVVLVAAVALVPATGGILLGGTPGMRDAAESIVAYTRLLTAALLLALARAPAPQAPALTAAAGAFAVTGGASLAAMALASISGEASVLGVLSAQVIEQDARAALPLGIAFAATWRWDVARRGAALLLGGLTTLAVAVAIVAFDLAVGEPRAAAVHPDASHVVLAGLGAVILVAARRPTALWRWGLVAAAASVAAAWTRLDAVPVALGWYLSLALSVVAAGVVLVGVVVEAGKDLRDSAVLRVRRSFEDRLAYLAAHDEVTALPNGQALRARIDEELAAGREVGVILLALEGQEDVLEAFGQQRVDDLLRAVASRLGAALGALGTLGRVGDEELVLLIAGLGRDLLGLATQAVRALDAPLDVGGVALTVGAVAGCARGPRDSADSEVLLRYAGVAARAARRRERTALEYAEGLEMHRPDQIVLLSELRPAIARGELVLFYQPKARMRDRTVVGVEALVRWRHPTRGIVPPSEFIPLAERTDVINELTAWAVGSAAERCAAWHREGLPLTVAVNLPARSLAERDLLTRVEDVLERSGIDHSALRLEVTESAAMTDVSRSFRRLHALRGLGVSLAIDDFGTGYSSLSYLARLPIDEVKIDGSFVRGVLSDKASAAIVRSATELCHQLGYSVTAEGAEDEATWNALADMGCDDVQGYFVGRPLPPDELLAHLRSSGWILTRDRSTSTR